MGPQSFEPCHPTGPPSSIPNPDNEQKQTLPSSEAEKRQRAETTIQEADNTPPRPRRFLAQPIETTTRRVQKQPAAPNDHCQNDSCSPERPSDRAENPPRRFLPQPIETSKTSKPGATSSAAGLGPRRFKPELLETDYRSVKGPPSSSRGRNHPDSGPRTATVETRVDRSNLVDRLPQRSASFDVPESRFSYANLLRRQEIRRHSFRVPDLPSIPSSGSESSDTSQETPSPFSFSLNRLGKWEQSRQDGRRKPENAPDEYSGYLLSLAARSAQKELKEQALAAFPNEQVYQPVDHFAIDEEGRDSEDDEYLIYPQPHHLKSRRQSSADLSWELEYMRQHKEEAEQRLRAMVSHKNRDFPPMSHHVPPKKLGPSPPMLGADLVLPQSLSPEGTLSEDPSTESNAQGQQDPCTDCGGLWCAGSQPDEGRGAGLWMGTCRKAEGFEPEPQAMSGIVTPMIQCEEFFTPSSPPDTPADLKGWADSGLNLKGAGSSSSINRKKLDAEFNDSFITQIYNYLSLGYPCIARYYDHELSKISGIAVEELRQDDLRADARGYVVAPDDEKVAVGCVRWKALRLYIHEWARQQPNMAEDEPGLEAWGVPERRGSWAI